MQAFGRIHTGRQGVPLLVLLACSLPLLAGCTSSESPTGEAGLLSGAGGSTAQADTAPLDDETLRAELDEVLEFTLRNRHLSLQEHAAWQILHGVLAYQREFLVDDGNGGRVSAVDHLLGGGYMKGWAPEPGVWLDEAKTRRGLRSILEQGSKAGQGHTDQWLAILAQCDLAPDQEILVRGEKFTMRDYVGQVLWDVPRNVQREYSWTLIGLTTYLPTDHTWTASDGKQWSIEQLVRIEAEQDLHSSACGGSHRLIGMTMALNRHLEQGGKIEGGWKLADERIQEAIKTARAYQNPDGSFSINYFSRPGRSPDLAQNLGSSGHTLEFLTLAMTDEQLREPWVQRAAVHLCEVFRKTREYPLECGALYHAAHGLVLYRHRLFGPRRYGETEQPAGEEDAATPVAQQEPEPAGTQER